VENRNLQRDQLIQRIGTEAKAGTLWPELYAKFGLATNATPELLAESLAGAYGWQTAFHEFSLLLWQQQRVGNVVPIDPQLAARYGLTLPTNALQNAKTNRLRFFLTPVQPSP
jgi:hypothetical protein